MQPDTIQLAVEAPVDGLRVVLVAGDLDRVGGERLSRLLDLQVGAVAPPGGPGHVVVDLANVRFFGVGGLEALVFARDAGLRAGVDVHLAGLGSRELLLPQRVRELLAGFSVFDTLEAAVRRLRSASAAQDERGRARPTRSSTARTGPATGARSESPGERSIASTSSPTPALAR